MSLHFKRICLAEKPGGSETGNWAQGLVVLRTDDVGELYLVHLLVSFKPECSGPQSNMDETGSEERRKYLSS